MFTTAIELKQETKEVQMLNPKTQKHSKPLAVSILISLGILLTLTSCTFKTPATETPVPNDELVEKSFFVDPSGKAKTFMCGWASTSEVGYFNANTHQALATEHCNVEFEISENYLIGKLVNPTYEKEPERLRSLITIPILRHFYYEKDKDDKGRETNVYVRNSSRSHWSARPYIELDLKRIRYHNIEKAHSIEGTEYALSAEDIEWDKEKNFLAFSIDFSSLLGVEHQGKMRFNFLKFESNPNFKKTPFNDENYRKFNTLHVAGESIEGVHPILYAAHWDLSKKHEIVLNGFPEKYIPLAKEVVADWNDSLAKIGAVPQGTQPFVVIDKKLKHAFDLRYISMTWVQDKEISGRSPLGIAMNLADVRNGEMLWGGIVLWGGLLENYIKANTELSDPPTTTAKIIAQLFGSKATPSTLPLPDAFASATTLRPSDLQAAIIDVASQIKKQAQSPNSEADANHKSPPPMPLEEKISALNSNANLQPHLERAQLEKMMASLTGYLQEQKQKHHDIFATQDLATRLMGTPQLDQSPRENSKIAMGDEDTFTSVKPNQIKKQRDEALARLGKKSFVACSERTFDDVISGWQSEMKKTKADSDTVILSVVKELISHEYGHFIGLGHQFKENILPEPGTVPEWMRLDLQKRATPEAGFTNFSSVMGYRDPRSEIATADTNLIKPGFQDHLVLRFLYKQEYPTYQANDCKTANTTATAGNENCDFTYHPVPASGMVPRDAAYFPQCNDLEASFMTDPYCNRFDRGTTASQIVESYFERIRGDLTHSLNAFTDARGKNAESVEGWLWYRSFNELGRVRLFYDYMRIKYKQQIDLLRSDEKSLFGFSRACRTTDSSASQLRNESPVLAKVLTENPELAELCRANGQALSEMESLVSLKVSDHTIKDFENSFAPGGIRTYDAGVDYGRVWGTWKQISGLPLKYASIFASLTPWPWLWSYPFAVVPKYDSKENRFSYSSLYPFEYTKLISSTVAENLQFASDKTSETTLLGQSVLALAGLRNLENYSNDAKLFPPQFTAKLKSVSGFEVSVAALLVNGTRSESDPTRLNRFTADIIDFNSNQSAKPKAKDVYLLPNGKVLATAANMFLVQLTPYQMIDDTTGFAWVMKLSYSAEYGNDLDKLGIKSKLHTLYNKTLDACLYGNPNANGLSYYFTTSNKLFQGFKVGTKVAESREQAVQFLASIDEEFKRYYSKESGLRVVPNSMACDEALRGMSLVASAAALANGLWLPGTELFLQN